MVEVVDVYCQERSKSPGADSWLKFGSKFAVMSCKRQKMGLTRISVHPLTCLILEVEWFPSRSNSHFLERL